MRRFYLAFQKVHTLCEQLSWSHYRLLISVENEEARAYYLEEARKSLWSVRELQRQINSFYYERLLDEKHCLSINPPNLPEAEAIFSSYFRCLELWRFGGRLSEMISELRQMTGHLKKRNGWE